jgi:hypothetical protein
MIPSHNPQTNYLEKIPAPMTHLPSSASSASSSRHSSNIVNEKHASIVTRFNSRLIMQKDPMTINFAPTISKGMLNEMISTEKYG